MRKTNRRNISTVAFATAFLLVATLDTPSTTSSIPDDRPAPPTAEEVVIYEELLDWVRGGPRASGFHALDTSDVTAAVTSVPTTTARTI